MLIVLTKIGIINFHRSQLISQCPSTYCPALTHAHTHTHARPLTSVSDSIRWPCTCVRPMKTCFPALAGVLSGLSASLCIKGLQVQFPVRAHAWVVGQVPSRACVRGNHTLMFLSLSYSLPSPLPKDKFFF